MLSMGFYLADAQAAWEQLAPGMELGTFVAKKKSPLGDSRIIILRMDTRIWELALVGKSWQDETEGASARQWCKRHQFTAAINAGMYGTDYTTHLGYLGSKGHINNSHINGYKSVAAFDPKIGKELPYFRIFDLDRTGVSMASIIRDYNSVFQNLRLIRRPGENRWSQQEKMWNEAALAEDGAGRVLFIYCRSPFTMHDFNQELLSLDIDIVAAQHLEGGMEAQLFFQVGNTTRELFGRFENSSTVQGGLSSPWPIPNVLGVRPRLPVAKGLDVTEGKK